MRDLFKTVVDWKVCKTLAKTQILCNFSPGCQMTLIRPCFNPKIEQFGNQKGVFHKILSLGQYTEMKDISWLQKTFQLTSDHQLCEKGNELNH